jgi:dolichol-phosphate mannosyltransferase
MMRREVFEDAASSISGKGFKILLDLIASANRRLRIKEIPFVFRSRQHGESKLDTLVMWEYLMLIADKLIGRFVPVRFALFVLVGSFGALFHLMVLGAALHGLQVRFAIAQSLATFTAMVVNFFVNNLFTYRDQRVRGWRILLGLGSFIAICAIGAVINVKVADELYTGMNMFHLGGLPWWLAGLLGAAIGAVWNYAVSSTLVWGRARQAS